MDAVVLPAQPAGLHNQTQIRAAQFATLLEHIPDHINILSLDCFDTLIWRNTSLPRGVFYAMQQRPVFKSMGVTAKQRIKAAAYAYRHRFITQGTHEIKLKDIYSFFSALSPAQQAVLVEEELITEIEACYGFQPVVELIRQARQSGLSIIIVSDTYFEEVQLRRILHRCLPEDVYAAIDTIFCSSDYGKAKKNGLFNHVINKLAVSADEILHIGDNQPVDFDAPRCLGINALHFVQFDQHTVDLIRLENIAAAITNAESAKFSPFRGVFALANPMRDQPASTIGYMTMGPIMYAFAQFLSAEVEALRAAGKRPKVFFLMRDAYLLAQACAMYSGQPIGKCVHIRKWTSIAAQFRTKEDVDRFLSSVVPWDYGFEWLCEQLLLPKDLSAFIVRQARSAPHPELIFNEFIHQGQVLQTIFNQSAAYRERLKRYLLKEMDYEPGDTWVLADVGYLGTTQKFLTHALAGELDVEITGRYVIASSDPSRPPAKGLIHTHLCDHDLFEQLCTFDEGSAIDYDEHGCPVFESLRLSAEQYARVKSVQAECIRFVRDAKAYFSASGIRWPLSMLHETAITTLRRQVYLPTEAEVHYLQIFQQDKNMGHDLKRTVYNINHGATKLQQSPSFHGLHPYEARTANMEIAISALVQRIHELEITDADMSLRSEMIPLYIKQGHNQLQATIKATPTHDGYYSFILPLITNANLGIPFGVRYQWLQFARIELIMKMQSTGDFYQNCIFDKMVERNNKLYECTSDAGMLTLPALAGDPHQTFYHIIYRPIIRQT